MAGNRHKFLVKSLIARARSLGYDVLATDTFYPTAGESPLRLPQKILRHHPDLLAARKEHPVLCIGEAKTAGDLHSRRTREQLQDYASIPDTLVMIAVPEGAVTEVRQLVSELDIRSGSIVQLIAVPEVLLPE